MAQYFLKPFTLLLVQNLWLMNWWSRFTKDDWRYLRRIFFADEPADCWRSLNPSWKWLLGDVSRIRSPPSLSPTMHQLMLNPRCFFKGQSKTKIIDRPRKHHSTKNFRGHWECAQCQCGGDLSNQAGEPSHSSLGHRSLRQGSFVPMKK